MHGSKSTDEKEKTVYRLYAMRTTNEAISAAEGFKFARITREYTMIYEKNEKIIQDVDASIVYTIIGEHEIDRLSDQDRQWLNECNLTIIAEEAMKNKGLVLQSMEETLAALETELEKNREMTVNDPKEGASAYDSWQSKGISQVN